MGFVGRYCILVVHFLTYYVQKCPLLSIFKEDFYFQLLQRQCWRVEPFDCLIVVLAGIWSISNWDSGHGHLMTGFGSLTNILFWFFSFLRLFNAAAFTQKFSDGKLSTSHKSRRWRIARSHRLFRKSVHKWAGLLFGCIFS